jgi:transcriptional regulator with XRE-family HTH domain
MAIDLPPQKAMQAHTTGEHEALLGERLKGLRLSSNLDQASLASRAGVSLGALKNLEGGAGSRVKTLIAVLRALGREEWLASVAPGPTSNPLDATPHAASTRQRATRRPAKASASKGSAR